MKHFMVRSRSADDDREIVHPLCRGRWDDMSHLTPFPALVICKDCKSALAARIEQPLKKTGT